PWRGSGLTARCGHHRSGRTELGADLFAVGMLDLVEDRHRLPPRPAGGPDVTGAVVDVAEAGEGIGLVEPVGEVTGERDGPLVAHDGLVVVAPLVMGAAEAVPDGALPVPFPHLPHGGQGAFVVADGLFVVAKHGVRKTDVLERD